MPRKSLTLDKKTVRNIRGSVNIQQFARQIGASPASIARWERGEPMIEEFAYKYADLAGSSIELLQSGPVARAERSPAKSASQDSPDGNGTVADTRGRPMYGSPVPHADTWYRNQIERLGQQITQLLNENHNLLAEIRTLHSRIDALRAGRDNSPERN